MVDMFPTTGRKADMFPITYVSNFIATTHVESIALIEKVDK